MLHMIIAPTEGISGLHLAGNDAAYICLISKCLTILYGNDPCVLGMNVLICRL